MGWQGCNSAASRFTTTNICDFIVYNHPKNQVLLLELKSTKQKSMPFTNLKKHQVDGLKKAAQHKGVIAYFVFEFRTEALCYAIPAIQVFDYYNHSGRKSFPFKWCSENGFQIPCQLRRIHYTYSVDVLL